MAARRPTLLALGAQAIGLTDDQPASRHVTEEVERDIRRTFQRQPSVIARLYSTLQDGSHDAQFAHSESPALEVADDLSPRSNAEEPSSPAPHITAAAKIYSAISDEQDGVGPDAERKERETERLRQTLNPKLAEKPSNVAPMPSPELLLENERKAAELQYGFSGLAFLTLEFYDPDVEREFLAFYDQRSTVVLRRWMFLILLFHVITYVARDIFNYGTYTLWTSVVVARGPSILFAIAVVVITLHPRIRHLAKQPFLACVLFLQAVFLILVQFTTMQDDIGDAEISMPNSVIAAVIIGYTAFRLRMAYATAVGWGIMLVTNAFYIPAIALEYQQITWATLSFNVPFFVFNVIGMVTCFQIEYSERKNFQQIRTFLKESAVAKFEQERGEFFLHNILPGRVVSRLKSQPTIAERLDQVTVMFLCVENLMEITAAMDTRRTVQLMNQLYAVCDRRADEFGVEKVKTIQEKYMCVGGAPDAREDHAQAVADMLLAVFQEFREMQARGEPKGIRFSVRAGVNSGPIVAGVIGLKKFCWDIWGDTVNTASRMEYPKGGVKISGAIRVSESSYQLLQGTHDLVYHGEVEMKGKGQMKTYLLVGRKQGVAPAYPDIVSPRGSETGDFSPRGPPPLSLPPSSSSGGIELTRTGSDSLVPILPGSAISLVGVDSPLGAVSERDEATGRRGSQDSIAAEEAQAPATPAAGPSAGPSGGPEERRGSLNPSSPRGASKFRRRDRRSSGGGRLSAPVLELNTYVDHALAALNAASKFSMDAEERTEFNQARFQMFRDEPPAMRTVLLVAVCLYAILGIMDPVLGNDLGAGHWIARFAVVIPVWLAHGAVMHTQFYTVGVSTVLSLVCIVTMVVADSYISRQVEALPETGAEFYAVLPIFYAVYCCYAVFGLSTVNMAIALAAIGGYLAVECWAVGYCITRLQEYFIIWFVGFLIFGMFVSYTIEWLWRVQWHFSKDVLRDKKILEQKREEADRLLRNIVPENVIPALTSFTDMTAVAKTHDKVAILWSDVAGFTALSDKMEPFKLVSWLNAFFFLFDSVAAKFAVEKIKTIGDAYVACSGIFPDAKRHFVNDVVNMGLTVQAELKRRNESNPDKIPVNIRIGVHVGPILSGIIGQRKFQFDIFGRAVHIAEEMESSGQVGRVHISDSTRRSLIRADQTYIFTEGPEFDDDDGRVQPTWFVDPQPRPVKQDFLTKKFGTSIEAFTAPVPRFSVSTMPMPVAATQRY